MELKGVTQTRGHLASNGGLRGHSVGDVFPVIISFAGTFDNLKRYVTAPDGASHLVNNDEEARELAEAWLMTRQLLQGEAASSFERCKVKANIQKDGTTECEAVYDLLTLDFDFYSIYARDKDGYAFAVWDSKGKDVNSLLMSFVVLEFLEKRGVKLHG